MIKRALLDQTRGLCSPAFGFQKQPPQYFRDVLKQGVIATCLRVCFQMEDFSFGFSVRPVFRACMLAFGSSLYFTCGKHLPCFDSFLKGRGALLYNNAPFARAHTPLSFKKKKDKLQSWEAEMSYVARKMAAMGKEMPTKCTLPCAHVQKSHFIALLKRNWGKGAFV